MAKISYSVTPEGEHIQTQREAVLDHLKRGGTLTQEQARAKWSITRLPSIINTLRKQLAFQGGEYRIITKRISHINRFGASCHFGEYHMERADKNGIKKVEE